MMKKELNEEEKIPKKLATEEETAALLHFNGKDIEQSWMIPINDKTMDVPTSNLFRKKVLSVTSLEDAGYASDKSPLVLPRNPEEEEPKWVQIKEDDPEQQAAFQRFRKKVFSFTSLEDAGFDDISSSEDNASPPRTSPTNDDVQGTDIIIPANAEEKNNDFSNHFTYGSTATSWTMGLSGKEDGYPTTTYDKKQEQRHNPSPPMAALTKKLTETTTASSQELNGTSHNTKSNSQQPQEQPLNEMVRILKKIASKAMQPPAIGAMAGFVVTSSHPLRGLFVDLTHRADNAPLEWIFDGVLTLAQSAIPVNMCVVGVNLDIAYRNQQQQKQRRSSSAKRKTDGTTRELVTGQTIAAVVLGKMLIMPLIGIATVVLLKKLSHWHIPLEISFQFYLVLLMNFVTPTANVVMVIAELGSGPDCKNVMASLIGWQYVVAPVLLSLTVMMIVWTAVI
jgi:predicted permease